MAGSKSREAWHCLLLVYGVLCCDKTCYAVFHQLVWCCTAVCCVMLCCAVLYYVVSCYVVLCIVQAELRRHEA